MEESAGEVVTTDAVPEITHEHRFDSLRIRDDDGRVFSVCLQCGERKYES